jgi:hypothetical protein
MVDNLGHDAREIAREVDAIIAEQKEIDARRAAMADETVAGFDRSGVTVEDWKRFARDWIVTAAQHADNERYLRDLRNGAAVSETPEGEPAFTLLGRDPLAPKLVRLWAAQRWSEHGSPEEIAAARACADAMDRWHVQHLGGEKR